MCNGRAVAPLSYIEGPVSVTGSDPYGLDGYDNDGVGCES
jgi:hypothetical protein